MEPLNGTALVTAGPRRCVASGAAIETGLLGCGGRVRDGPGQCVFPPDLHRRRFRPAHLRRRSAHGRRYRQEISLAVRCTRSGRARSRHGRANIARWWSTKLRAGLDKARHAGGFRRSTKYRPRGIFPGWPTVPYALGCIPNVLVDIREDLPFHVQLPAPIAGRAIIPMSSWSRPSSTNARWPPGIDPLEYRLEAAGELARFRAGPRC